MSINRLIPNVALRSCRQTMLAELLLAMLAIPACGIGQPSGTAESVEWSYDGPGAPEKWASLSEEYATCAQGRWQSPVDITGYEPGVLPPVGFSYHGDAAAIRNDGRAIYVDYAPGNTFSVGQHMFELESAHFHQPSEHRIDGVNFPAELHLVHVGRRGFAVVALLFEVGQPDPVVAEILDAAPAVNDTVAEGIAINASGYPPGDTGYFRYDGSKTTPPCDEPVEWYVMRELKTISRGQVDDLLALSGGPNNRPIQPKGNRTITVGSLP